jgi:hypothetical protein
MKHKLTLAPASSLYQPFVIGSSCDIWLETLARKYETKQAHPKRTGDFYQQAADAVRALLNLDLDEESALLTTIDVNEVILSDV